MSKAVAFQVSRIIVLLAVPLVMVGALSKMLPFRLAVAQDPQPARQPADGKANQPQSVPLTDIAMYTAGVGYFEHQAELEGDGSLDLRIQREQIDDLLKSLIVQDFGGGNIEMVTYGSHAPAEHALQSFALDLASNPSLAQLLQQARGEMVTVKAPNATTGIIVSVEEQKRPVGKDDGQVVTLHILNLLVDKAVKPLPLNLVQSIEFEDAQLHADFQKALQVLARSHNSEQKALHLSFSGEKTRGVHVGYVRPMPVWKMTYRLALRNEQPHILQGWAIVENTTQQDWNNVNLTLVSGQPVTFEMPLYQPMFVDRPTVELDLYESLKPQTYAQDLRGKKAAHAEPQAAAPRDAAKAEKTTAQRRSLRANALRAGGAALADRATEAERKDFDLRQGVQAAADASELGELFQYAVKSPVTLSREQSALIPVLNAQVEGEQYSIYEQSVFAKHPLYGLRLKNTSDLHLMEGPITVLEDGRFAGEALIEGISPGGERLISYGIDLEVEVSEETATPNRNLREVRIVNGILHAKYQQLREHTYRVKNSCDQTKQVLIVVPKQANWKLTQPEALHVTRDDYRFLVSPAAAETADLQVELRRTIDEQLAITNLNPDAIVYYTNSDSISPAARQAMEEVADRKQAIQKLQSQLQTAQAKLNEISNQQQRIRQNMQQLDRNTDLYTRYVIKLGNQEDRLESLRNEVDSLQQQIQAKQNSLNAYIGDLNIQ